MKRVIFALAFLTLVYSPGVSRSQSSFDMLLWLEGDWVRETKHGEATESWRRVSENTMEGVAFISSGDSTRITEYMRIERFGQDVFFTAKPGENPFPTAFMLTECDEKRIVFDNPNHDFPQRIIYTRNGADGFVARIEGVMDGEVRGRDFIFERKK